MKSCPSPWPLLPPHCSTQGWPKCKPCKVAPVLYPTIPQTPPNHLCLLVYTAFAAKASPSFAPAPPHGRQKHLQPSCAKEKSSLVFCNQDKCSLQRQVSRKVNRVQIEAAYIILQKYPWICYSELVSFPSFFLPENLKRNEERTQTRFL